MRSQEWLEHARSSCCPVQQRKTASKQNTILVVEMAPIIEELLVKICTLANYRVYTVDWRQIATHAWIEHAMNTLPDSIVLDVDIYAKAMLQDPLDFLHAFSERWNARLTGPDTPPIILLTTQAQRQNELQQKACVDAVVTKPFKPQFLLDTIKTALEQKKEISDQEIVHTAF